MRTVEKVLLATGVGGLVVLAIWLLKPAGPPPVPVYHLLSIATSPESNTPVSICDSEGYCRVLGPTPVSLTEKEGIYTIILTVPNGMALDHWEDETGANLGMGIKGILVGDIEITISLASDKTLTAFLSEISELPYCCPYCPARFATMLELLDHMIKEHPEAWELR